MRVRNKLLNQHLEDIQETNIVSETEASESQSFQDGSDLASLDNQVGETEKELEGVMATQKELEEVKAVQDANIKVMEEGLTPEEAIAQVEGTQVDPEGDGSGEGSSGGASDPESNGDVAQSEGGEESQQVTFTEEMKEGVLSEQLPEDDAQAVDVIENQMQAEQYMVESIYGQLVGSATFKESAAQRFASLYGIRTNGQGLTSCQESLLTASPRQEAIRLYKVHSEAIGESIKKLGGAAWNGLKELVKQVIKFIKNIFANKDKLVQGILACGKQSDEILKDVNLYELTDEFKQGYTEITPASVLLGVSNLEDHSVNVGVACSAALILGEMLAAQRHPDPKDLEKFKYKEIKFKGVEFEGEFKGTGTLYGTKFYRFDGVDSSLHNCVAVNLKFSNVQELAQQVNILTIGSKDQLKRTIDKFKEIEKKVESLEGDILKSNEAVPEFKEEIKEALQLTKLIFQYPKVVLAAAQLGLSGIKHKDK